MNSNVRVRSQFYDRTIFNRLDGCIFVVPPEVKDARSAGCSLAEVWNVAMEFADPDLSLYDVWHLVFEDSTLDPAAEARYLTSNVDTLPKVDTKLIFVMSNLMARLEPVAQLGLHGQMVVMSSGTDKKPDAKLEFCRESDEEDFVNFMNAFCGWDELMVATHWCAIPPITCAKCLRLIRLHWPEHAESFFRMLEQIELAHKASECYGGPFFNELSSYLQPRYSICLEYVIYRLASGSDEDLSILQLVEHHFFSSMVHLFFPMHSLTELNEINATGSFLQILAATLSAEAVGIAQGGKSLLHCIQLHQNLPEVWRRLRCAEGFDLALLQRELRETEVVLYYLPLPTDSQDFNCIVWGITKFQVLVRRLAVDLTIAQTLISGCERPPRSNSGQTNWIDAAFHLGGVLLMPLESLLLQCDHVVMISQGELARLPFHVLLWQGQPLIMSRTVSNGSSLSELAIARQTQPLMFAKADKAQDDSGSIPDPSYPSCQQLQSDTTADNLSKALVICNPESMKYHMGSLRLIQTRRVLSLSKQCRTCHAVRLLEALLQKLFLLRSLSQC